MKEFGALVVDWSVCFDSERDEGVRVVETCVLGLLSAGRPFRRATCIRRREVQVGVGDSVGDGDVPRDIFPLCHAMSVMPSGRLPSPLERPDVPALKECLLLPMRGGRCR